MAEPSVHAQDAPAVTKEAPKAAKEVAGDSKGAVAAIEEASLEKAEAQSGDAATRPVTAAEPGEGGLEASRPEPSSHTKPQAAETQPSTAPAAEAPDSGEQQEAQAAPEQAAQGRGRGRGRGKAAQAPLHRKAASGERRSNRLGPSGNCGPSSAPAVLPTAEPPSHTPAAEAIAVPAKAVSAEAPHDPAAAGPEAPGAARTAEDTDAPAAKPVAAGVDEGFAAAPGEQADPSAATSPAYAKQLPSDADARSADTQTEKGAEASGGSSAGPATAKKPPRKSLGLLREVLSLGFSAPSESAPLFPVTWGGSAESTRSRSQTTGRPSFSGAPPALGGRSSAAEDDTNAKRTPAKGPVAPAEDLSGVNQGAPRRTRQAAASEKSMRIVKVSRWSESWLEEHGWEEVLRGAGSAAVHMLVTEQGAV